MPRIRITATVEEELARKARARAALDGQSLPDVIRDFLMRYASGGLPGYSEIDKVRNTEEEE